MNQNRINLLDSVWHNVTLCGTLLHSLSFIDSRSNKLVFFAGFSLFINSLAGSVPDPDPNVSGLLEPHPDTSIKK